MTEALRETIKRETESAMGKLPDDWRRLNHGFRLKIRTNGMIVYDTGTVVVDGPKNSLYEDLKNLAAKAIATDEERRAKAFSNIKI